MLILEFLQYVYVNAQESHLNGLLERFIRDYKEKPPRPELEAKAIQLASMADLFGFYRGCIVKAKEISGGFSATLFAELTPIFKKFLKEYANR